MQTRRRLRVYVDTSVFGGVFDEEFTKPTKRFFQQAQRQDFALISSVIVLGEITDAPARVRRFFDKFTERLQEIADMDEEIVRLRDAYIEAGVISERWLADASHVATATVTDCSILVSWNFRHIVNFKKVPMYNAVNLLKGYPTISIWSPLEVIEYEEEKEL